MPKLPDAFAVAGPIPTLGVPALPGPVGQLEANFQQALLANPGGADVFFVLGMLALRGGRPDAAVEAIGRALAMNPANPDYHYAHGAACLGLGRHDEAAADCRQALRLRPDYAEAHQDLGRALAALGRHAEAAACHREALRLQPEYADACYHLGVALANQGQLDEAAGHYRRALQLRPDYPGAAKDLGLIAARQGRLDEAADRYGQALREHPEDPDTHNDLGIVHARRGKYAEAADCYRAALRLRPDFADAHNNLGNALRNLDKLDEAVAALREALRLRPAYPEAHNNLGIALKHQKKADEAIAHYQHALRLRPAYAEAHNNLAIALAERGKVDAAVICYQQAVRLKPDYFEALGNLANLLSDLGRCGEAVDAFRQALRLRPRDARLHKNLGIALARQDKPDEAIASYREALKLKPDYADAHNDLGIALARQGNFDEAVASYREALRLRPSYAEAHNNLGNALRNGNQFDASVACYLKALELKPDYADAHNNLGIAYAEMGRFDEAVASYTQCMRLRPNHVDAHMNRALTWLRKGDYAQGWAEYEWRWKKRALTNRPLIQPQWNGFPLAGRRILLITEQGFGDTLQFVRYAPLLKAQGATVILECPERLVKLLGRCPGIDHLIPQGQPLPDYDVYAPLLTLPGLMGTSVEAVPANVPYIEPDPELVERWRAELAGVREFKVGINWQGNPKYAGDRHRSIPLAHFEPLARVPGVKLFSLQKSTGVEQLPGIAGKFAVVELGSRLDEATGPFLDTAAVLKGLDLFITSDTAVVHLAGALGVPVWMALSTTPDWRWMAIREDNAWYPTMRVFRQERHMDWPPVFARMAAELRKLVPAWARSVPVEIAPGELLDKLTILEIKAERIADPGKRGNVLAELEVLAAARDRAIIANDALGELTAELKGINEALWGIEDDLRDCERAGDFGARFVELARSVYKTNDRRAAVKRRINVLLGSELIEEKSYAATEANEAAVDPVPAEAALA